MLDRPLLPLLFAALAGILADRYGLSIPLIFAAGTAFGAALVLLGTGRRIVAMLLAAALLAGGLAWARSHTLREAHRRYAVLFSELRDEPLYLCVDSAPILLKTFGGSGENDRFSFIGTVVQGPKEGKSASVLEAALQGARVRVYASPVFLKPDDIVALRVQALPPRESAFPGSFPGETYLERLGVDLSARGTDLRIVRPASAHSPRAFFHSLRTGLVSRTLSGAKEEAGRILAAVLFGYREGVSGVVRGRFRQTGTGHLLAISGLHVGLVTGLAWLLLRALRFSQFSSALGSIGVCLMYLAVSGLRPSAVRAGVMAAVYLGGFVVGRRSDLMNALACAALLILFHYPPVVTDAGFLLSFTAVVFLSRLGHELHIFQAFAPESRDAAWRALSGGWRARLGRASRRLAREAWGLFLLSIAVWAGLWPLSAYYFKLLSFSGILLNVFVIPWLSIVLAGGLLLQGAYLMPAWAAGHWTWACVLPTTVLLRVIERVAGWEFWILPVNPPSIPAMLLYYALFGAFFARKRLRLKARHFLLPGAAAVACLFYTMESVKAPPEDRITVFSAGAGECAAIETREGGVALVGHLPWQGLDAIDLLRFERRGRLDTVLYIPPYREDPAEALGALEEQFGRTPGYAVHVVEYRARQGEAEASGHPSFPGGAIPSLPGGRVDLVRDESGRLLAWTVWAGGMGVLITERNNPAMLLAALRKAPPSGRPRAAVFRILGTELPRTRPHASRESWFELEDVADRVFARLDGPCPEEGGVMDRREWGAIRLMARKGDRAEVTAYDGERWRPIETPGKGAVEKE
ncbi:MAG: ComEC/Rec2 family competence protein [Planctomycetota bacterium]